MTILASVELFVINICSEDSKWMVFVTKDIVPPVWLCIFGCTTYDASTQVIIIEELSVPMIYF